MTMKFKNPEILISLFNAEDIVTTSLTGNASAADRAIRTAAGDNATVNTLAADFSSLEFNMGD